MKRIMLLLLLILPVVFLSASCAQKDNPAGPGPSNTPTATPVVSATPSVSATATPTTTVTYSVRVQMSGDFTAAGGIDVNSLDGIHHFSTSPFSYDATFTRVYSAATTLHLSCDTTDGTYTMNNAVITVSFNGVEWAPTLPYVLTNGNYLGLEGPIPASLTVVNTGSPVDVYYTDTGSSGTSWWLANGWTMGVVTAGPVTSPTYQFYSGDMARLVTCTGGGGCNDTATIYAGGSPVTTNTYLYGNDISYTIP